MQASLNSIPSMEKTSSSSNLNNEGFELISHPDRTLEEHLAGCDKVSKLQLSLKYIDSKTFFEVDLLEKMRHLLVYFHDFGKGTDFFAFKIIEAIKTAQKEPKPEKVSWKKIADFALRMKPYLDHFEQYKRGETTRLLRQNQKLGDHSRQGAYYVLSAFEHEDIVLRFILLKIILKHHGDLSNFLVDSRGNNQVYLEEEAVVFLEQQFAKHDFDLYQKILDKQNLQVSREDWKIIKSEVTDFDLVSDVGMDIQDKKDIRYFFLQHFLFSMLLSADKGDVQLPTSISKDQFIKENRLLPNWLIPKFKEKTFGEKNGSNLNDQREEAFQLVSKVCMENADQSFFSITLPTGMGKTFAAYNVAVLLQNAYPMQTDGKIPRIVYCLPFTSIIDQNASILEEILGFGKSVDPRIQENWLSKNHYLSSHNETYDERELTEQEPEYLAEGWEQEIIVTTFVQMLESIFTNKNRALRKFHNMTNAVFILDEVQNIAPKYYEAIETVFRGMAAYFNTKFVFVTATQPFLFKEKDSILELTTGKTETYFRQLNRIKLDQSLLRLNDYKPIPINDFWEILCKDLGENPDKSFLIICNTIAQSRWFFNALEQAFPTDVRIYLSSSLLPPVRRWKIRQIKKTPGRKIVVSTQVVEAGVDIDLDVVYRDFAPIDSINQSAGRCNRNALRGTGAVKLFNLGKHRHIYDKVLMTITEEVLKKYDDEILESQLFDLNSAYAAAVRKKITDDNNVSQKLIQAMQRLELETIEKEFQLIEEDHRHYNVFLPCCVGARIVWEQYQRISSEITDPYERKTQLKKIKPRLLQYITRFPMNKNYEPDDPKAFLIYETNWQKWYELDRGFRLDAQEDTTIIY